MIDDGLMLETTYPEQAPQPAKQGRSFEHELNEWVNTMAMSHTEHPEPNETALLVKELVLAIRDSEESRADPLRTPKFLLPFASMAIMGLIYAGVIWAKIGNLETKMQAVDSIQVVAAQVSTLQHQQQADSEQLRSSQQRLEDRLQKFLDDQARRDRAR